MASIVAVLVGIHVAALMGFLAFARYSAVLVDEQGRPIQRKPHWHERLVFTGEVERRIEQAPPAHQALKPGD